jgi:hypothetical protein
MPVIGFLDSGSAVAFAPRVAAFRLGLSETGYVEGQNAAIEYRSAEDQTPNPGKKPTSEPQFPKWNRENHFAADVPSPTVG